MKYFAEKSIRSRVLLPLSLTFAVLFGTFIFSSYQIRANQNLIDMRHRFEVTQAFIKESLAARKALLHNLMGEISHDEQLRQAMRNADSDTLYQLTLPLLEHLSQTYGISHFYYHAPIGTTLLRVYNPGVSGDKVERNTFAQAARSREFSFGLELGKSGTLTYRGVLPWLVEDELIGYIELGIEFDFVLRQLQSIVKEDFWVTLDKQVIDPEQWRLGRKHFGRPQKWELFSNWVIAYQTLPELNLAQDTRHLIGERFSDDSYREIKIDQQTYRIKDFPLRDSSDRLIGSLSMLHNITQEKDVFQTFVFITTLLSGGLCLSLFFFSYGVLGRMDRRLVLTRKRLRAKVENLKRVNGQFKEEIAQRHKAERELQLLNETLEERVAQRTAALEAMNLELQEKHATILHQDRMACIGQLAAGIAHDINNPVGFISHNLTIFERYLQRLKQFIELQDLLIKSHADAELPLAWEKGWQDFGINELLLELPLMLNECRDGTQRISQTVQTLRNFSHKEIPRRKLTDLHQCIDSSLSMVRHQLRDMIRIVRDFGDIPQLYCCPGQLNQVFLNLLINAIQAIESQGEIRIRTWADDLRIFVSIRDSGCGIPPDRLERIFEPFFTTKAIGVGTGLGLSIVCDIISHHQGKIEAASQVGEGTTFTLQFPVEECTDSRDRPERFAATTIHHAAASGDGDD